VHFSRRKKGRREILRFGLSHRCNSQILKRSQWNTKVFLTCLLVLPMQQSLQRWCVRKQDEVSDDARESRDPSAGVVRGKDDFLFCSLAC
jgi:hypothetical protein